jgi:glycerol-3-phosphate acyltransferase PlsY
VASFLSFVIGYLLGSIGFGVIVPRLRGIDIYEHGSGNPGMSNVMRTVGKKPAAVVLVGDLAKGVAAAAIGDLWVGETVGFAAGFAAVLGHVFPIWHRFRGGRGVATALGVALWLEPVVGLVLAILWTAIVLTTKTASIASLVVMALYVPGMAVFGHGAASLLWSAAIVALVVARHAPNIRRMLRGVEQEITR